MIPVADPAGRGAAGDPLARADPQGVLRAALHGLVVPAIAAEEILLDWLLGLGDGVDPAAAAHQVIAALDRAAPRNDRLIRLLTDVASWPASRLSRLVRPPVRGEPAA